VYVLKILLFSIQTLFITGQECVFGSYDHIRLYSYQPRKGMFEEAPAKEIKNMYTVTAMAWRSGIFHILMSIF
jgi:intraflagellar transport protein 172